MHDGGIFCRQFFGLLVMLLINLTSWGRHKDWASPKLGSPRAVGNRYSDGRPGWSSKLDETEFAVSSDKNKLSVVLWDAVRAVVVSVGMVIALMALLEVLSIR